MPDTPIDIALDAALASLAGLPIARLSRADDGLAIQLGALRTVDGDDGPREVGTHTILVACPWRWCAPDRVIVGSGDLLTPADANVELEDYDWDEPGASWLDVRLDELSTRLADTPVAVRRAARDAWLGLRVELDDDTVIELFPNSTPTGHVSTEFWRVISTEGGNSVHVVTGTFGIDRE